MLLAKKYNCGEIWGGMLSAGGDGGGTGIDTGLCLLEV